VSFYNASGLTNYIIYEYRVIDRQ